MKLKEVTKENTATVQIIKATTPGNPNVKLYDKGKLHFIHAYTDEKQTLSISNLPDRVSEIDIKYGVENIMKLDLVDIMVTVKPSNIVIISEKPKHIPKVSR